MGNEFAASQVFFMQVILMLSISYTFFSMDPVNELKRAWRLSRERRLMKRQRRTEEKLRRYWEIDASKFRQDR